MSLPSRAQKGRPIAEHILLHFILLGVWLACIEILLCFLAPVLAKFGGIPVQYRRPVVDLWITMGIGLVLCIFGGGVVGTWWKKRGGKQVGLRLFPFLSLVMILSALASIPWMFQDGSRHIDLSEAGFSQSTLIITDSEEVHLHNSSSLHPQIICLGEQQHCNSDVSGPRELEPPGLSLSPGQTATFTFSESGTYHLTILTARAHTELTVSVGMDCLYVDYCGGDD